MSLTTRVAAKDDVIPLARPLRLPNGEVTDHVAVAKGQEVAVPIGYINTAKEFWGEDAGEWKPERWLAPLPAALDEAHLPGVYANL